MAKKIKEQSRFSAFDLNTTEGISAVQEECRKAFESAGLQCEKYYQSDPSPYKHDVKVGNFLFMFYIELDGQSKKKPKFIMGVYCQGTIALATKYKGQKRVSPEEVVADIKAELSLMTANLVERQFQV